MPTQILLEPHLTTPACPDAPTHDAAPSFSLQRYAPAQPQAPAVIAGIGYLRPTEEPPYHYLYPPPDGQPWQNCDREVHSIRIADARSFTMPPSIHREGFELWDAPSSVADFGDEHAIRRVYYREAAELARAVSGARYAYVFDHLVRKREAGRPPLAFGRRGEAKRPAATGWVHNDYTEASGRKRLGLVLGERAAEVGRYAIVNIWRSISGPVVDTPLAVCDARTMSALDLVPCEVRYPDRTGEIYLALRSPRHRWAWYSRMDRHEALVFKQYDSQLGGTTRFTPHTAFDLPDVPPDAPLRESIEVRCLVVYE